jgi:uncharacterized membrane protein YdbT with pleckstrin-like domain
MPRMSLPPLSPTPHLSRLLGPNEAIIYTGKLHPFHGLSWLLAGVGLAGLAWGCWALWPHGLVGFVLSGLSLLAALACLGAYLLPFRNTEIAVTTHRLLLRHGRFHIHTDEIDATHIDHYQLHQTPFSALFHYGTFILNLQAGKFIYVLTLREIWHPMTLLEALTTLNPLFHQAPKP